MQQGWWHCAHALTWPSHAAVVSIKAVPLAGTSVMVAVRHAKSSGAQSALALPSTLATAYPAAKREQDETTRRVQPAHLRAAGGLFSCNSLCAHFLSPESTAALTGEAHALAHAASKVSVGAARQGRTRGPGLSSK